MTLLGDGQASGQGEAGGQGGQGSAQGSAGGGQQGGQGSQGSQGGQGAGGQTSWRDTLPEEMRNEPSLALFNDVPALAKSYLSTKAMVGKKGVIMPKENAAPEEWTAFYRELGQPELDKFEIKTAEGKQVNPELVSKFKENAHKLGLLPKQAQGLLDWFMSHEEATVASRATAQENETKQKLADLRKEWGEGYDRQIALGELGVEHLAKELGGEQFIEHLKKSGATKDPVMIKAFNMVGKMLGEDKLRGDGSGRMGKTPAEIRREIDDVMGNKSHPYWNPNHPSHRSAVEDMLNLHKKLAPAS